MLSLLLLLCNAFLASSTSFLWASSSSHIILITHHPYHASSSSRIILILQHPHQPSSSSSIILITHHPHHTSSSSTIILIIHHPYQRSSSSFIILINTLFLPFPLSLSSFVSGLWTWIVSKRQKNVLNMLGATTCTWNSSIIIICMYMLKYV